MQIDHLSRLVAELKAGERRYLEFLRSPSLSCGIYALPAGGTDEQKPHTEDEIYYVVSGRSRFRAGTSDQAVEPGTILFVPAGEEHRFHSIGEDLLLLVLFAPPEGSQTQRR
jgi:mannose-6-phosphate isomerase-like protein (cupin superfamily)